MLQELAGLYPHQLEEVNIDDDAALRARYHLTIPVIRVGSIELAAPIGQRDLEAALRSASES